MKKIVCLILLFALLMAQIPVSTFAVDHYLEADNEVVISSSKNYSPVPCYGEYEITEPEYMTYSSGTQDQYESNNSFYYATRIIDAPDGKPTDISVDINATLHQGKWFFELIEKKADEDYYYFDLYGEAEVMFELSNIPAGYDYDLEIYKLSNIRYATSDSVYFVEKSNFDGNSVERIALTLQPGRYYIWVYAYEEECSDSAYYNLSVDVDYTARDVSINYLRYNKGAKAAIWVSDFDPCGIAPFSTLKNETIGYEYTDISTGTWHDYYENDYLQVFSGTEDVDHAAIYIWDAELAEDIMNDLERFRDEIELRLADAEDDQLTVDIVEGSINALGVVTGIYFTVTSAGMGWSIASTAVPAGVSIICALLPFNEEVTTKEKILTYLNDLIEDVDVCVQTQGEVTVKIYSRYKISVIDTVVQKTYYCDYTPLNEDSNFYFEDVIPAYTEKSVVNGKVYGIIDGENVIDALNREEYTLPDINLDACTYVYSGYRDDVEIDIGEYQWYYLIAPRDGWYMFYTDGSVDVIGELFYGRVPDDSTFGRIAYEDDLYEADDGNDPDENFSILINVTAGTRIFLRVSARDSGMYTLRVRELD